MSHSYKYFFAMCKKISNIELLVILFAAGISEYDEKKMQKN